MAESAQGTQERIDRAKREAAPPPERAAGAAQGDGAGDGAGVEGLPPDAPEAAVRAAQGVDLSPEDDRDAADWLCAPQRAHRFRVRTEFETDAGTMPLTFVIKQIDSKRIDEIEKRNMDSASGTINRIVANAEIVAEACELLEGAKGHKVDPKSEEFRAGVPSTAVAFEQRFFYQAGVLSGVAGEVRRVAGWSPDRVGTAQRVLVEAASNS